jgi:hypothetical protein
MNQKQRLLFVLALILLAVTASSTHGTTTVALDRTTGIDVVSQDTGLLAVSQTTTGFNATTNNADLTVAVTNQLALPIDRITISVDGTTKTTGRILPGATDSVSFTGVDCSTMIMIKYDTEGLAQRVERPIDCR